MLLRSCLYLWLNMKLGAPAPSTDSSSTRAYHAEKTGVLEGMGHLPPLAPDATVLVIGCDEYAAEVGWFAKRVRQVFGVDVNARVIDRARGVAPSNVILMVVDGGGALPLPNASVDFVYMHNVCEHLLRPGVAFQEYRRVVKPGGMIYNSFAPLFYSPFGAHQSYALRLPWGHLLFGVQAVVQIRNAYYPGQSSARTWEEFDLNRLTLRRYDGILRRYGFRVCSRRVSISKGLPLVGMVPGLRNLFVQGVTDTLVREA